MTPKAGAVSHGVREVSYLSGDSYMSRRESRSWGGPAPGTRFTSGRTPSMRPASWRRWKESVRGERRAA